ncbi:MAG: hypothetical protein ACRC5U_06200, partial [Plesiomonas sp.]
AAAVKAMITIMTMRTSTATVVAVVTAAASTNPFGRIMCHDRKAQQKTKGRFRPFVLIRRGFNLYVEDTEISLD